VTVRLSRNGDAATATPSDDFSPLAISGYKFVPEMVSRS
jgi:hypothetical protein